MIREINDVYDLRAAYYEKHPNGHFFDGDTLKFFRGTILRDAPA